MGSSLVNKNTGTKIRQPYILLGEKGAGGTCQKQLQGQLEFYLLEGGRAGTGAQRTVGQQGLQLSTCAFCDWQLPPSVHAAQTCTYVPERCGRRPSWLHPTSG